MTNLESDRSILHRGCQLRFDVRGEGTPVLFIQGVGVHGDGWRPQVDQLSAQYQCLSFDNRGMGKSQPMGEKLTFEQMADDVLALMNHQQWESAHVVGHSLGGLIALHLALTARARVKSLSLLCTFARGRDATRITAFMFWVGLRTRVGTRRQRRNAFLQIVMPKALLAGADRDALAKELEPIFGHDLADHPPVVSPQLAAMRAYDATPRLHELAGLPTLVVSAIHDPIARPQFGRDIAARIKGAKYVELADASHGATIHCADRVNRLLLDHVATGSL